MEKAEEFGILRRYIAEHQAQLIDLLTKWDRDECGDGRVSAKDFRHACRVMQFDAGLTVSIPRDALDSWLNELRNDLGGAPDGLISLHELARSLARMPLSELHVRDVRGPATVSSSNRRKSKSLPSSPLASPTTSPLASPMPPRRSPGSRMQTLSFAATKPRGEDTHAHAKPLQRSHSSQAGMAWTGSDSSAYSHRSGVSGCSSSTATGLTPKQRRERRDRRERELYAPRPRTAPPC